MYFYFIFLNKNFLFKYIAEFSFINDMSSGIKSNMGEELKNEGFDITCGRSYHLDPGKLLLYILPIEVY